MPSPRDEQLKSYASQAARRLARAGESLARRQASRGNARGGVAPWPESAALDFHGTLQAIWVWSRADALGTARFRDAIGAAWSFVEAQWRRFVPTSLGATASEEAPYDCAMVLRAAVASRGIAGGANGANGDRRRLGETAARLLGAYLADLDDLGGRAFSDPGFLAWSLLEYARASEDRGLLANGHRFVERAFGMKAPPAFAAEPAVRDALFDFSCTTATRVLAVLAAEGRTPFVGAWMRERVAPLVPAAFVERPMDANAWNATLAAAAGQAYVVSTDPRFLTVHNELLSELANRVVEGDGGIGRAPGFGPETQATFHYALALDALVKE